MTSRKSSPSHLASSSPSSGRTGELPRILIDRSLGARSIPEVFREAGYDTQTIDDVFGLRPVEDTEWIAYADAHDMVVACKDDRIRHNPLEKRALYYSSLRVLCLTNGRLNSRQQVDRFRANMGHFDRLWRNQGGRPWVYAVHESKVERLRLFRP